MDDAILVNSSRGGLVDTAALVSSHQAYYTGDAVGQIVDATVRDVPDYRAGRRSENVLVPRSS